MTEQDKKDLIYEIQIQGMYSRENFHKDFQKYYVNNSNRTIQVILFFGILINLLLTAILFIKMNNNTQDGSNQSDNRNAQRVRTEAIIGYVTNSFSSDFEQEDSIIFDGLSSNSYPSSILQNIHCLMQNRERFTISMGSNKMDVCTSTIENKQQLLGTPNVGRKTNGRFFHNTIIKSLTTQI